MFETLRTLFRARAAEAEEGLIDGNATALLGQHLRDAEADIQRARRALAGLVAREKAEARRAATLAEGIARREEECRKALAAGEEALAGDIARRIVDMEDERERAEADRAELARRIGSLRNDLADAERRLAAIAAEWRAARAGAVWREGRAASGTGAAPGSLEKAEAMAKRLGETGRRIEDEMAELTALRAAPRDDLDARIEEAGIATGREERRRAVLARLGQIEPKE